MVFARNESEMGDEGMLWLIVVAIGAVIVFLLAYYLHEQPYRPVPYAPGVQFQVAPAGGPAPYSSGSPTIPVEGVTGPVGPIGTTNPSGAAAPPAGASAAAAPAGATTKAAPPA